MNEQSQTGIRADYTPHARAERLISAGRFVLAFSSFVAVYFEPSTPERHQHISYALLAGYTLYALAVLVMTWRRPPQKTALRLASHAADLLLFSIFVYLTEGPASPFFLYFIFSLFCATLRFPWRGILLTGAAAVAVYGALAFVAAHRDPGFDVSRVIVREAYLSVITALLVYLGIYQQRLREELAGLAAWPRDLAGRIEHLLETTLAHAAVVLRTRRLLIVWEEREEPWIYTAVWDNGAFMFQRMAPGTFEPLGSPELRNMTFFVRRDAGPMLVYDPARSSAFERDAIPAGPRLRDRFDIRNFAAVSLESETLSGHLLATDVRNATADDLALAHIAGRLVLAALEEFFFVQQVKQSASAEERMRISRELHDGIVQSLGGVGLQLQSIRSQLPPASPAAERLDHVQNVIEQDQRELRTIVRELRPHDPREGRIVLSEELRRMRGRFALEWNLEVELEVAEDIDVPASLALELCRIVNESLSNAARHGGATRARVAIARNGSFVDVSVSDNGRGFAFTGRYELDALERTGDGPRTLRERVKALGGTIAVQSSSAGASVEARVPVEAVQ